jgi:ribosomal protein S27E
MQNSAKAQSVVLNELYKRCGIQFQESELSPSIRNGVDVIQEKLQEIWQAYSKIKEAKSGETNAVIIIGLFVTFGIVFIITSVLSWFLLVISFLWFLGAWMIYIFFYEKNVKDYTILLEDYFLKTRAWNNGIETLSKEIVNEVSALNEQKAQLKDAEVKADFVRILKLAQETGLVIEKIKCPSCGASIMISESGSSIKCPYCGENIQATDYLEKLKALFK